MSPEVCPILLPLSSDIFENIKSVETAGWGRVGGPTGHTKNLKKCTIEQNNFLKRVDKDLESGYYQIKITPKKKQKKDFCSCIGDSGSIHKKKTKQRSL